MTQARQAKYCPRCRAMAARDAAVCSLCGHHFRTGAETPIPSADDELNRTRMFDMPPPVRPTAAPTNLEPSVVDDRALRRLRVQRLVAPALIVTLIVGVLVFLFWIILR